MASQKQYEMLFQLNAKLGSQYSSALKAAQSELLKLNQEYRSLATTANDISAYQRQQTAVDNTKSKLELLQQQYDNIQKEMQETGTYSSDLENKMLAKKAQIEKTTKAYNDQVAKLDEYKRRLQEAGVDTTNLDKESERLKDELKQLQAGFNNAGDGAEEFGDKGSSSLENIEAMLASAGIIKGLKEIYEAFSECVTVAADFEESMSNVEAISGANEEEIAALTERAKELGASTAFTAKQVSEGMSYMAMAGWKTTDMLDGMDAVLALAAASGEDLGTTSDIVTDALTAFGLTSKDTARFADVLAAASSNANTNVGMMGETFKYAAPVAGALGYSIEDVAVAIGLMANSGIKASQAGTTLRNIFNGILGGVDLTSKAFGDLNVSFVNTDGTMMDLASTISKLRGYFDQMTEAERVHNALSIAGQRGYAGLLAILNSTAEDYDKLSESINNSTGAAQRMANIKLDNMNGQLTIAKSAWEGLQIAIGEQFTPALQGVFSTVAALLGKVTEFVKAHPGVVKAIAALTIGLGAFVVAITAAKVAQAAFNAVAKMNTYVLLAGAITGVVVGLTALDSILGDSKDPMEELTAVSREQEKELADLKAQYDEVAKAEGETSTNAQLLKRDLDNATAAFENNKQTMAELLDEAHELNESYWEDEKTYQENVKAIKTEQASNDSLIASLIDLTGAETQSAASKEKILAIVDVLNERIPELGLKYDELTGKLNLSSEEIIRMAKSASESSLWDANYRKLQEDLAQQETLKQEYEKLWGEVSAATGAADEAELAQRVRDFKALWEDYAATISSSNMNGDETLRQQMLAMAKTLGMTEKEAYRGEMTLIDSMYAAKDAYDNNEGEIGSLAEGLATQKEATEEAAVETDALTEIFGKQTERIELLTTSYLEAYNAAYDSITGQYKLWDEVAEVSAKSVDDVTKNLEAQAQYWNDYNSNIQTLLQYSGEIEGLSGMVAEFGDGSADSVNMIAGMAEAAKSGNPDKIMGMVEAWQANKQAQDEAAQSLGDLVTRYTDQMDEIKEQVAQDVSDLKFTDEAYLAATDTVQSFIDGAISKMPAVQNAYARIASAAASALATSRTPHNYTYLYDNSGYASGTDYATPGWHLVGENGPEVRWFNGGETVWDANETRDFLQAMQRDPLEAVQASSGGATIQVSFAPQYNLSGASDSAEIRAMLAEHDEEMQRQIREMLAEEAEDMVRRRM